jgi:negative regulator of sigma-B (phosphoserine phosphatase)
MPSPTVDGGTTLEWGVAAVPMAGEASNGDLHLVVDLPGGGLVAAVDALGHGPEAARTAERAVAAIASRPADPLPEILRRCHQALIGSRGVVASLATFDTRAGVMTWAGIGNVEGVLIREGKHRPSTRSGLINLGGIVGAELPEVRAQQLPVDPGDTIVFATDGIRREFIELIDPRRPPGEMARDLLARHAKGSDDALILVVRYRGASP